MDHGSGGGFLEDLTMTRNRRSSLLREILLVLAVTAAVFVCCEKTAGSVWPVQDCQVAGNRPLF
jgi:hypothetical protein